MSFTYDVQSSKFAPLPSDQLKRVLVTVAIQEALLEAGKDDLFEEVCRELLKRHACGIDSCFENPVLLIGILREACDKSYSEVIGLIRAALAEFSYDKSISRFLKKICVK